MIKNKPKIIFLILIILMVFSLSSCDLSGFLHQHTIDSSLWEKNEQGHWHSCSGCSNKVNYQEHIYEDDESTICTECGWVREIKKQEEAGNPEDSKIPLNPEIEDITDEYIELHSISTYGYTWLKTQTNGDNLQEYYRQLDAYAKNYLKGSLQVSSVNINANIYYSAGKIETKKLSLDEVKNVYTLYCFDHPYNFWQDQAILTGYSGYTGNITNYVHLLVLKDYNTLNKTQTMKKILNENIKKMYAAAAGLSSRYEITAAYYNAIAKSADYSLKDNLPSEEDWAHGIVGIFDNSTATGPVCEGYARAFQLLLNLRGVDNVYCVGYASDAGMGGGGAHAWNMAQLEDGKWYYYDLTWDDGNDASGKAGGTVNYDYFALSASEKVNGALFTETHFVGNKEEAYGHYLYDLPKTIAGTPFSTTFKIGSSVSEGNFVFVRNGVNSVCVEQILTKASVVTIPEKVMVGEKAYIVTELGPYLNEDNKYATILSIPYTRSIIIPQSIQAIRIAAFYCGGTITIYYHGTQEEWQKIHIGKNAFNTQPKMYYQGQWKLSNGIPVLV